MKPYKNQIGVHALVWVGDWSKESCRTAIKNSAEAGYSLIEIPALDPASIDTADTITVLKEFNMNASSRNQLFSIAAALFCAFVTVGMSIAPALPGGIV